MLRLMLAKKQNFNAFNGKPLKSGHPCNISEYHDYKSLSVYVFSKLHIRIIVTYVYTVIALNGIVIIE